MKRIVVFVLACIFYLPIAACNRESSIPDLPVSIVTAKASSIKAVAVEWKFGEKFNGEKFDWGPVPKKDLKAQRNFFNQPAPGLWIEKWVGAQPEIEGKFVLVDFWATWCPRCQRAVPELNEIAKQFQDELVVVGITDETEEKLRAFKIPVKYFSAIDSEERTKSAIGIWTRPHILLIDPAGMVCWQGFAFEPGSELTAQVIQERIQQFQDRQLTNGVSSLSN